MALLGRGPERVLRPEPQDARVRPPDLAQGVLGVNRGDYPARPVVDFLDAIPHRELRHRLILLAALNDLALWLVVASGFVFFGLLFGVFGFRFGVFRFFLGVLGFCLGVFRFRFGVFGFLFGFFCFVASRCGIDPRSRRTNTGRAFLRAFSPVE